MIEVGSSRKGWDIRNERDNKTACLGALCKDYREVFPMKIIFFDSNDRCGQDQWVQGLGYIYRNGSNFLPAIVRLEELLSGSLKVGKGNG